MKRGKKYINNDVIYVSCKKHFCPICSNKLSTIKVSKIVNYQSPEASNYDFTFGCGKHRFVVDGDVEFIQKEFYCIKCEKAFTVDEIKKNENVETNDEEANNTNSNPIVGFVIFFIIGIVVCAIIELLKNFIN